MNARKTTWLALGLAMTGLTAGTSHAANPARLNINVAVTANLSVAVNNAATSTQTVNWNTANPNDRLVSPSSSTVLNDSGILTEKCALSTNANSIPASGTGWTLGASTSSVGADTFGLQAVFGSSNTAIGGCASVTATTWNDATIAPPLTAGLVTYTSTVFGSTELNNAGGSPTPDLGTGELYAGNKRALCYRTIMSASTSKTAVQNVQVIVTAQ